MAITNPEQNTNYCIAGQSGAKFEWQDPSRDIEDPVLYPWDGVELNQTQIPVRYSYTEALGPLVDTLVLLPSATVTSTATLDKDKFYTFIAENPILLTGGDLYDACFFAESGSDPVPSNRLTITNDEPFERAFFLAAQLGDVVYDPVNHRYSVGYIGNDSTVSFNLPSGGSGTINLEIYENVYSLLVTDSTGVIEYVNQVRDKPFLNINIACGGDCPSRTDYECDCNGTVSCYADDQQGNLDKAFEGTKNP